ncbi:uncharacterized protein [Dermacentor andersoni]|uniref:uncharacterized protein n=1 Tax=Dermacentor andersoni TaxID=34620 RepID=UPI002155C9FB|nr:uncharacterized protein LOC126521521 [Dermacentor andersoni]
MCRKQLTLMAILVVTARALPIADPKTDGIAPINIQTPIMPEKTAIHSAEKTPIISETIPSTYADGGAAVVNKETGKDVQVEPKPYKTSEVDSAKAVSGGAVPDVEPVGVPAADGVSSSFRSEIGEAAPTQKVEPEKAPTLSVGDIGTNDPLEGPNQHKVEGVLDTEGLGATVQDKVEGAKPYEVKTETTVVEEGVAVEDETTRDEKVPEGVEQYGSVLEFSKYDTNSDGVIDVDEWSIIHGGHEKITGQFHAADINGDKQLEHTEFQGASWYHDGDQSADIARDALMLAIAEQAATAGGEHNHAMGAAIMPSTEFRYIVDDAESSAQSVPVIPAEPADVVVVPEKPAVPSANVDAAAVKVSDVPTTAVPPKDVVNTVKPVATKKEKTEVPQVTEVVKDVQRTDKVESPDTTTPEDPAVVAEKKHGEVAPLI